MRSFRMKKLLFALLLGMETLSAMQPVEKTINLIVGEQKFPVPESVALEAITLKNIVKDLGISGDIELSAHLSPKIIEYVARIMRSYYNHKELKNKALLDAIEKDVPLKSKEDFSIISWLSRRQEDLNTPFLITLMQTFNYLDFPIGLELVARAIANSEDSTQAFMKDSSFKGLRPLVAKYYYLLKQKNLPNVDDKSYGLSIQDYLDYLPQVITARRKETNLALSRMRLNSLEGISNIPNLARVHTLWLENNRLHSLPANSFNGLTNLSGLYLAGNQLRALPAGAFNGLVRLSVLNLDHNLLSGLPVGIFSGLSNLRSINLSYNQIAGLPAAVFDGLANVVFFLDKNPLSAAQIEELREALPRMTIQF